MLVRAGAGAEAWHGDRVACAWRRDVRVARWGGVKRTEGERGVGGPGRGRERVHRVGRLEPPPFASGTPVSLSSATTWSPHPPDGGSLSVTHTHTHTFSLSPPLPAAHRIPAPVPAPEPAPPRRTPHRHPAPFRRGSAPVRPSSLRPSRIAVPTRARAAPNSAARRGRAPSAVRTAHRLQVGPNDLHPARPLRVPDHYSNRASILACGPVAARCRLARARGGSGPPPMARPRSAAAGKGGGGGGLSGSWGRGGVVEGGGVQGEGGGQR